MYLHKLERYLTKWISTLQAEADMLADGRRNSYGETHEHIVTELKLLKKIAGDH